MGHRNVSIYSDDSGLVIRLASALRESHDRLHLVRSTEELLAPVYLELLDLILIDERLAAIDTWSLPGQIRRMVGSNRVIAILGLVEKLDNELMLKGRELNVDAFLLKSAIGDLLMQRMQLVARQLPVRESEPAWSPFLDHHDFLDDLRTKIEIVDIDSSLLPPTEREAAATSPFTTGEGVSFTVSWREERSKEPRAAVRFRQPGSSTSQRNNTRGGSMPDLIGHTLGRVLIQEEIGRGGGGIVYSGRHTSLDLKVAVKVLYPDLVRRDPSLAVRFLEEARTAARIQNGSVVRVLDCDRHADSGCYFIVMEHIAGSTLEQEIKQSGWIPEPRLTEVAIEIVRGLTAAETLGIVHRDIKPANILFTDDLDVKVADLGLARIVDMKQGLATGKIRDQRSNTDLELEIVGTPLYISPEVIERLPVIDSRCDIYSLGATLHHAATGTPPFAAHSASDLFFHHLNTPPRAIVDVRPEYSREFSSIVLRMLGKRPEDRYSSCRELLGVLRDHHDFLVRSTRPSRPSQSILDRLQRRLGI